MLPKAELHLHLDGSLLPSFLFPRAERNGSCAASSPTPFPSTSSDLRVMVDLMKAEMRKGGGGGHVGLPPGANWPMFDLMNSFLQTAADLTAASQATALHLFDVHNVKYLEVRFCPKLHTLNGLTERQATEAVCSGLSLALSSRPGTKGGTILCALRSLPGSHALDTATLASAMKGEGVVGFDVAGSEQYPLSLPSVQAALDYCKSNKMPVTVHAGELPSGTVPNLEAALAPTSPVARIGHGAALALGDSLLAPSGTSRSSEALLRRAREKGVVVEVCLTAICTKGKGLERISDHPVRKMVAAGVKVALSSDNLLLSGDPATTVGGVDEEGTGIDRGFSYSNPSGEVALLVSELGFSWSEVKDIVVEGFWAGFGEKGDEWLREIEREVCEVLEKAGVL